MSRRYTPRDVELLSKGFREQRLLLDLEVLLDRPLGGIVQMMEKLALQNPANWAEETLNNYRRDYSAIRNIRYRPLYRNRILTYLKDHPDTTANGLRAAGLGLDFSYGYDGKINNARRDAGIDIGDIRRKKKLSRIESSKKRIIECLLKHPSADIQYLRSHGLIKDFCRVYTGNLTDARRDAGILPEGYVSAKEAVQILGYTKQGIFYLFDTGKIEGMKLGRGKHRRLFLSRESIESWKVKKD